MAKALCSLTLVLILTACNSADTAITARPLPSLTPIPPTSTPSPLTVSLGGAVTCPGEYTLPPGSLLADALQAAGGPAPNADLDRLNLAQALEPGQYIHVPAVGEVLPTPTPYGLASDGRIDINLAGAELLQTLPNVGPATAQNIIEYRQSQGLFEKIEDIVQVKGIGEKTFEKIQDLITVGATP